MNRKPPAILTGPVPKYRQLLILLRDQILSGELAPGQRIPSEEDLVNAYGLSRGTVRKAIAQLESEKMIETEHGVGSFVSAMHPNAIPFRFVPGQGVDGDADVHYEVLAQHTLPASWEVAEKLKLAPGASVIHIARRKYAAGQAVAYSERYLIEDILPSLLEEDLTRVGSVHALLESASEYPLLRAELQIEAHRIDEAEAALLQAAPGEAAIAVSRLTYTAPNRPAVWYWGLFRSAYHIGVSIS
ncbi:MAG: GntR family transcriptional regulator [Chloroflexota bacterium]